MKKSFIATAFILTVASFPGCKKAYDYIEINPNAEIKNCTIQKIIYKDLYSPRDTIVFTYNSCGDPLIGTRPSPGTGAPNYIFKYDKKGRLTDFIGMYAGGTTSEFWQKFFYDGLGNIVFDSTYLFCKVQNGQPVDPRLTPEPDGLSFTFYTYDVKGRVIKDSIISISYGWNFARTYSYNTDGNRTGREYDQKINFRRTNKIWMFIDRDYSINNPFTADSYNSKELPTKINLTSKGTYQIFLGNYFLEADITYSCK